MKIEVLLSTMYQNEWNIVDKCNIRTDAVIVNQCNEEKVVTKEYPFGKIKMIYTCERGLSKSRNMALNNSTADICLLCDDDVVYHDTYLETVKKAFEQIPGADVIVFNIISKNPDKRVQEKLFHRVKKIPYHKSYGSVHIAFRRESILSAGLKFNTNFGTGSGLYSFAEDSLFFAEIHRCKLKSYIYPGVIADLYCEKSSWFRGFDEKYFYDTGAFLAAGYPILKNVFKWYYPLRLRKQSKLSIVKMVHNMDKGIYGYKQLKKYENERDE